MPTWWPGPRQSLKSCAHPVDLALQRFHTGQTQRHGVLLHFGDDPVTADLPAWFGFYNGRQTIEAGIKEGKGVFQMHHLKVRTAPALWLQEQFAAFAANFVRWAAHWLSTQCYQEPDNGWSLWQPASRRWFRWLHRRQPMSLGCLMVVC